jgi:hypothetical protein
MHPSLAGRPFGPAHYFHHVLSRGREGAVPLERVAMRVLWFFVQGKVMVVSGKDRE